MWQHIEMFNIGLAEEIYFMQKMNIYPANVTRIQNNLNSDNIDLDNNPNQYSSQGFPAIDYLLFGHLGDCHLHFHLIHSKEKQEIAEKIYRNIVREASRLGGVYSAEHGTGKRKRNDFIECYGDKALEQVKLCKLAFKRKS